MKATELRIGNLVYNPTLKEIRTIDCLDIRDLFEGRLWRPFEPIDVTHEWLEKLRFKCTAYQFRYETDRYMIEQWITSGDYFFRVKISDSDSVMISTVNYVHQLQNLYFALTGQELQLASSDEGRHTTNNSNDL